MPVTMVFSPPVAVRDLIFRLITGGLDPTGTYTLTHDFYVMTTEVSEGMWDGVMGAGLLNDEHGEGIGRKSDGTMVHRADFANALSTLTGKELCYVDSDPNDSVDQYDTYLDPSFATPYECDGYRLLTEAEEYASRSGSAEEFWTEMVVVPIHFMLVKTMTMLHNNLSQ